MGEIDKKQITKIKKLEKKISKMLKKTKDKEVEELCKELLNCIDSKYYATKNITVIRPWRYLPFEVDDIGEIYDER